MLIVFVALRPEGWQMALGFTVVFVALSLYLLPRLKGMFVALQWAKRYARLSGDRRALPAPRPCPSRSGRRRR